MWPERREGSATRDAGEEDGGGFMERREGRNTADEEERGRGSAVVGKEEVGDRRGGREGRNMVVTEVGGGRDRWWPRHVATLVSTRSLVRRSARSPSCEDLEEEAGRTKRI
jgi:hypothetical protein